MSRKSRVRLGKTILYWVILAPLTGSFIIGGFGSIAGALLGGYVLGALEIFIVAFLPSSVSSYRDAIVFSILIAFLLVRPGGLLKPNREIKL